MVLHFFAPSLETSSMTLLSSSGCQAPLTADSMASAVCAASTDAALALRGRRVGRRGLYQSFQMRETPRTASMVSAKASRAEHGRLGAGEVVDRGSIYRPTIKGFENLLATVLRSIA